MSNKGRKYIIMNTDNNSVHMVIAPCYKEAVDKARDWFGVTRVKVWRDNLSESLV